MQTVILAAGDGTGLRPLTDATPKPLLPVGVSPLLVETARTAVEAGASALYVVLPPDHRRFVAALGDSVDGVPVSYVVQPRPVGTADAVRCACRQFDGPFAVLPGDTLFDRASLRRLFESAPAVGVSPDPGTGSAVRLHGIADGGSTEGESARTWATDRANHGERGHDTVADRGRRVDGRRAGADGTEPTGTALSGACALPAGAHDLLDVPLGETDERDVDDVLARVGRRVDLARVEHGYAVDVDRPWDLLDATATALDAWAAETPAPVVEGHVAETAHLLGPVRVEGDARIEAGVVVEGPTVVAEGAHIGPNAYVRAGSYVGPDVHVGHAVEVAHSVLQRGASVAHLSYVGDSLVGPDAELGAGTTVADHRPDGRNVVAAVDDEAVPTGRRTFGVVVGPRVRTGIDTSLDAGVTLSTGATTEPDACVRADR